MQQRVRVFKMAVFCVFFENTFFFISFWIIFICHAFKYVKKEDKVVNISKRKIRIREDLSHQRKERQTYELLMTKKYVLK